LFSPPPTDPKPWSSSVPAPSPAWLFQPPAIVPPMSVTRFGLATLKDGPEWVPPPPPIVASDAPAVIVFAGSPPTVFEPA
jgi:hypothetical protein